MVWSLTTLSSHNGESSHLEHTTPRVTLVGIHRKNKEYRFVNEFLSAQILDFLPAYNPQTTRNTRKNAHTTTVVEGRKSIAILFALPSWVHPSEVARSFLSNWCCGDWRTSTYVVLAGWLMGTLYHESGTGRACVYGLVWSAGLTDTAALNDIKYTTTKAPARYD